MQRTLVILALSVLVAVALGLGVLASHWPFWARAWQWQQAEDGWPADLPGPERILHGGTSALPLHLVTTPVPADVAGDATQILLVAGADGAGTAYFAAGFSANSVINGRGLTAGLLAPLYGMLVAAHPGLLDAPSGDYIERWRADSRGSITPRQLLWQLSGLPAGHFMPFNPASSRSQLASGPDFDRAARHWKQTWPAGSHFEDSPVNAQLLALIASRLEGIPYAQLLEQKLWSQIAGADAAGMLDHLRGDISAHCCLRATAADWLRLGLLLTDDGRIGAKQLMPKGFVNDMASDSPVHPGYGFGYRIVESHVAGRLLVLETTGRQLLVAPGLRRALLWIGAGLPPAGLHRLLGAETASSADRMIKD